MRQDFETRELKETLEHALGFALRSLERLDGASALNFKAVRETDGLAFAVKCSPPSRQRMFDHLVRHLEETAGTKAAHRLFERDCPATFHGYNVICLTWCAGERRFPDELTEAQFIAFLDEYQAFSAVLQKATMIAPPDPSAEWREVALRQCRGPFGGWLRRLIERELPRDEAAYRPERLGVIHGDFHHGNFLFANGTLSGFFDLEEFCGGYPADDIVRYVVCAAEHLKWFEQGRKRTILARFTLAVRHLPYPPDDWLTAIDGLLVRKIYQKVRDRSPRLLQTINLLYRARFYLSLKRMIPRSSRA